MEQIFVITMYKFGHKQGHAYPLGAYTDEGVAREAAHIEELERGGKYSAEIVETELLSNSYMSPRSNVIKEPINPYSEKTNVLCNTCGQSIRVDNG